MGTRPIRTPSEVLRQRVSFVVHRWGACAGSERCSFSEAEGELEYEGKLVMAWGRRRARSGSDAGGGWFGVLCVPARIGCGYGGTDCERANSCGACTSEGSVSKKSLKFC
jgi:hypothetical protein